MPSALARDNTTCHGKITTISEAMIALFRDLRSSNSKNTGKIIKLPMSAAGNRAANSLSPNKYDDKPDKYIGIAGG